MPEEAAIAGGRRATALCLLLAGSLLSRPALAEQPQVRDAPGDSVGGQTSTDLVRVQLEVVRSTGQLGEPSVRLLVTMTLADVASTQDGIRYVVTAAVDGCGSIGFVAARTATGLVGTIATSCSSTTVTPDVRADRNAISWSVPLSRVSTALRGGSVFRDFEARVDLADPVFGVVGPSDVVDLLGADRLSPTHGRAVLDYGEGPGPWVMR